MFETNCSIVLSFFAARDTSALPLPPREQFSYHCVSSSSGWSVTQDGTIVPPSRSRIVRIRLGYPSEATITGFQLASYAADLPPEARDPWYLEPGLHAAILEPEPFPPRPGTKVTAVTFDLGAPGGLLSYRLAVDGVWDDPKIYNDPIE